MKKNKPESSIFDAYIYANIAVYLLLATAVIATILSLTSSPVIRLIAVPIALVGVAHICQFLLSFLVNEVIEFLRKNFFE